ncbi:MAG TPA: hypothetical protein PLJ27_05495 [Polyangiaceae bacterium]|jgi:hypothetical protein|nr:MAG: hypothetical protein BWY17_03661 [Deltaproteobacteria bacterium ADurb.Bin207]HNS98621.1 hypothetical protein [Polyangiaceae bacterium]HNZ24667.1 hypothetical protein [Polyangiaceae bacterium]HOD23451.1 hypothetical protein [Polyangiaceae bacterium]HOE50019.1 hypothetical protein [Polyangiaceae bacterium]
MARRGKRDCGTQHRAGTGQVRQSFGSFVRRSLHRSTMLPDPRYGGTVACCEVLAKDPVMFLAYRGDT